MFFDYDWARKILLKQSFQEKEKAKSKVSNFRRTLIRNKLEFRKDYGKKHFSKLAKLLW